MGHFVYDTWCKNRIENTCKNPLEELVVCHSATRLKQLKRLQESSIFSCVAFITLVSEVGSKVTKE